MRFLHAVIPFWETFSYFAYVLFILGYACLLGGLFNRLASSYDGARLKQEKISIFIGVVLGLVIALSLLAVLMITGSVPFVLVIGISKPFIDLLVLHKFLFAFPFVLSLTSITTSCFDYFAKAYCFFSYLKGIEDEPLNRKIKARYYEYMNAFYGICFGCLLVLGITTGLFLTGSLIGTPIAIAATIFITIIICNNVLAAIFSRLGRLIDGIKQISSITPEKDFYGRELQINKFKLIETKNLTSKKTLSLISLPRIFSQLAEDADDKQKFKLRHAQSCPTFFSYNQKKEMNVDNELFFIRSGAKSCSI